MEEGELFLPDKVVTFVYLAVVLNMSLRDHGSRFKNAGESPTNKA